MSDGGGKRAMTSTERSRKYRARLREDTVKMENAKKKDRERKAVQRAEQRKKQTKEQCEESRRKKREEMRKYRRKLKERQETDSAIPNKRVEGGKKAIRKQKARKAVRKCREQQQHQQLKKKEAVLRTQNWRLRLKLKSPTPNPSNDQKAFSSYSAERRAIRKVKSVLPPTPSRRSRVIKKLIDSPTTVKHLGEAHKLLSPAAKRKLDLAEEVLGSISDTMAVTKHSGTTIETRARAYRHVKAIVSKTSALRRYFQLRHHRAEKESNWWQQTIRQRKKRCDRIPDEDKAIVRDFYLSSDVSREVPDKRAVVSVVNAEGEKVKVQKHLMVLTLAEAYNNFKHQHQDVKLGFSSFKTLKPKQVRKISETSRRTCLCTICCNMSLKVEALKKSFAGNGDTPELKHVTKQVLADMTMCSYEREGHFPYGMCLQRTCSACGPHLLFKKKPFDVLLHKYKDEEILWNKWEYTTITKKEKPKRCMSCVTKHTTVEIFLKDLEKALENFPSHAFRATWQHARLQECQSQLEEGDLLAVLDFSENYTCCYQNEVQTAFFDPTQVTIFPMMFYFKTTYNNQDVLARYAIIGISDDAQHDTYIVRQFEDKATAILRNHINIKKVIEFTDGCAAQFKGRTSFADISLQKIIHERHFFETSHGKNVCDGLGALLKNACHQAVVSGKTVLGSATDIFNFANTKLSFPMKPIRKPGGQHEVSARQYVFVEASKVDHSETKLQVQTLQGTRKLHAVKNQPGTPYSIHTRNLSCFCNGCQTSGPCVNIEYVQAWSSYTLQTQLTSANVRSIPGVQPQKAKRTAVRSKLPDNSSKSGNSEAEPEPGDFVATKLMAKRRQTVVHVYMAEIIEIDESDAYVRFMKKSGRLYTWPDPEDCAFQPLDNLITKVKAPEVVNERLQYRFTDSDIEKVKSLLKGNTVNFS